MRIRLRYNTPSFTSSLMISRGRDHHALCLTLGRRSRRKTYNNFCCYVIFVSVRPQRAPLEERYYSRRNKGGSFVSASANNDWTIDKGMSVVSDGVNYMSKGGAVTNAAGVNKMTNNDCSIDKGTSLVYDGVNYMSKGGAVTNAAGVNKMTECSEVDGSTVLGEATGQRFHLSPKFPTLGCHMFHFLLQVGDLDRNVVYNGHMDDNGSPLTRPSPYSILE